MAKRFVFELVETRIYSIIGEGESRLEAENDALATFKRHRGSGLCMKISRPHIIKGKEISNGSQGTVKASK